MSTLRAILELHGSLDLRSSERQTRGSPDCRPVLPAPPPTPEWYRGIGSCSRPAMLGPRRFGQAINELVSDWNEHGIRPTIRSRRG
jgi:hypothetical protein